MKKFLLTSLFGAIVILVAFILYIYSTGAGESIGSIEIEMFEEHDEYLKILLNIEHKNTNSINQIELLPMSDRINRIHDVILLNFEKKDKTTLYVEIAMSTNDMDNLVKFLEKNGCVLRVYSGIFNWHIAEVRIDFNKTFNSQEVDNN